MKKAIEIGLDPNEASRKKKLEDFISEEKEFIATTKWLVRVKKHMESEVWQSIQKFNFSPTA